MHSEALLAAKRVANNMPEADLRNLNAHLCALIRERHNIRSARAAREFKCGDLVDFTARDGRSVRLVVNRINMKSLGGHEFANPMKTWRVAPTLCKLVGAD